MSLLEEADAEAARAHDGQTRRHGAPYIDHPRAVARIVDDLAFACDIALDEPARAAALLHDVVEDSPAHPVEVVTQKFGEHVGRAVALLTKVGKGREAVASYYATLSREGSTTTKLIKVCDRLHNLSELHKAPSEKKLHEYVAETREFVRPLAEQTHKGLVAAVDDAIDNALSNQGQSLALGGHRVPQRGLYAIVQPTGAWQGRLRAILDGGAARVQLRVKHAAHDLAWLMLINEALSITRGRFLAGHPHPGRTVHLVVNDRADLAKAAGADGVHVGRTDLPPGHARGIVGVDVLLGRSTHSLAQLQEDLQFQHDVDHYGFGPVWPSPTKQGHADVVGVEALAQACASTHKPIVAIGGITDPKRAAEAARAGASFCAVVSALDLEDHSAVHAMARRFALSYAAARASR